METKNFFIDTSIYKGKSFNFNNEEFQSLIQHIQSGRIRLFTSSIIDNEVKDNIKKNVEESRQAINELKKHYIIGSAPSLEGFFRQRLANIVETEVLGEYEKFVENVKPTYLALENVSIQEVLNHYFNEQPPFSKKKKSEFPDAINLSALRAWSEIIDEDIYILSSDNDFKNYCIRMEKLIHIDSIKKFLHLVAQNVQSEIKSFVMDFYEEKIDEITDVINNLINDVEFTVEEGDVNEIKICSILPEQTFYLDVQSSKRILLTAEANVEYEASVTYIDYANSPWDSEEKEYLFLDEYTLTEEGDFRIEFTIEFTVDFSDEINLQSREQLEKAIEIEYELDKNIIELEGIKVTY